MGDGHRIRGVVIHNLRVNGTAILDEDIGRIQRNAFADLSSSRVNNILCSGLALNGFSVYPVSNSYHRLLSL